MTPIFEIYMEVLTKKFESLNAMPKSHNSAVQISCLFTEQCQVMQSSLQ